MDRNEASEVDRMVARHMSTLRPDDGWRPDPEFGIAMLRERRAASSRHGKRWILLAAGAAAVCMPIVALPVTRAFAERCVSACVQETVLVRAALLGEKSKAPANSAVTNTGLLKPTDRRMAPDFALNDASGHIIKLSDFRGQVVLLNFWATWCKPCGEEIPWFVELQQANESRGFAVLGVSMDDGGWSAVKPYIEAERVNYLVMVGNDRVAGLFGGLQALPLTIVIDREGRMAAIHAGLCRKDEYETDISALLNER